MWFSAHRRGREGSWGYNGGMQPLDFSAAIQPMEWLASARALLVAAELTAMEPTDARLSSHSVEQHLVRAYCMLAGFAIENIVKGWLHECDVRHVSTVAAGELKKDTRTHGVRDLVLRTGIVLNDDEIALLDQVGECVVWSGRYPSPTKAVGLPALSPASIVSVREMLKRVFEHVGKPANLFGTVFERGVCELVAILGPS